MNPAQDKNRLLPSLSVQPITRRSFLQFMQCMGVGIVLGPNGPKLAPKGVGARKRIPGRVVHVRDANATNWDFATGWYGYAVDQAVVDDMMDAGLRKLTGASTAAGAWEKLMPSYASGRKIAIKVNFNNFLQNGPDPDSDINALIEPVNAVIGTLLQYGVAARDIAVYDVTHGWHNGGMPQVSFINRCLYSGVQFLCYAGNPEPFSATEKVTFHPPAPPKPQIPDLAVCNALVQSDYLVNMPLIKAHPFGLVTLGFKHHFGSVDRCNLIHDYLPSGTAYTSDYSPLVDLMKNLHFGAKTVLTLGDGLFGHWKSVSGTPLRWLTFGNGAPNSLFFSADPVAADSVMADFIDFERQSQGYGSLAAKTRDYLRIARKECLGVFEQGDPWKLPKGSGYRKISYEFVNGV